MLADIILIILALLPGMALGSLLTILWQKKIALHWMPVHNGVKSQTAHATTEPDPVVFNRAQVVEDELVHTIVKSQNRMAKKHAVCAGQVYVCMKGSRVHKHSECSGMLNPIPLQLCKKCFNVSG